MADVDSDLSPIRAFTGPYRFLSNFHKDPDPAVRVRYEGRDYSTVEHGYQASKTHDPGEKEWIRSAPSPGMAKWMGSREGWQGRRITLRPDWEEVRLEVMMELLEIKFQHTALRERLVGTGERELEHGNVHGDVFWGVCRGVGTNWLGRLLMTLRGSLR